jgi:transcriptional regulator with XRE-family HTH domain
VTLLRTHIGSSLRAARVEQERTLRDVAKAARVSLGYLSEVERGQKEASSELLNSICTALNLSLSAVLHSVSLAIAAAETPVLTIITSNSEVNSEVEAA